jgi:hypothetical protein
MALLFLEARGGPPSVEEADLDPDLWATWRKLAPSLAAALTEGGRRALARWVAEILSAELAELDWKESARLEDGSAGAAGRRAERRRRAGGGSRPEDETGAEGAAPSADPLVLAQGQGSYSRPDGEEEEPPLSPGRTELAGGRTAPRGERLRTMLIRYPTMSGGVIEDQIPVAHGRSIPPTDRARAVVEDVVRVYGPLALKALAPHAEALRRVFVVNHEERFGGRYLSGRRVGTSNLRRFVVSDDLRLFQKLRVPERLSYYFHLLIDVSPSMLIDRNAQKAIALGYAFADALVRLRIPVDVTLYSSAITQLFEHETDRLDLFFGGSFGYLSAGTREVEAIAYARQHAEFVPEARKILLVLTDGHPNMAAAERAGAADLAVYYSERLVPWLASASIELLGLVIGGRAKYHPQVVRLNSSWDSLGVLVGLLEEMIARGRSSHDQLWA